MDREFSSFPGIDIKVGLPTESLNCKNLCWNFCVAITFRVKMFGTNSEMNRCSRLGIFIGIAEDLHFMLAFKFNLQARIPLGPMLAKGAFLLPELIKFKSSSTPTAEPKDFPGKE